MGIKMADAIGICKKKCFRLQTLYWKHYVLQLSRV